MRIIYVLSFVLLTSSLFIACSSTKKAIDKADKLFSEQWTLQTLGNRTVETGQFEIPHLTFSKGDENRVSGNSSCNLFNGSVVFGKNRSISFSPLASTRKACLEENIEQEFLSMLEKVDHYELRDGKLYLLQGTTELACFSKEHQTAAFDPLPNELLGEWQMDFISGRRIAFEGLYPNEKPRIAFDANSPGEIGGNTSCNTFQSKIQIKGDRIRISRPYAMTMAACEGEGETAFLTTLDQVNHYEVSESGLNLMKDEVVLMSFKKKQSLQ